MKGKGERERRKEKGKRGEEGFFFGKGELWKAPSKGYH